jgi:hypothetical protein
MGQLIEKDEWRRELEDLKELNRLDIKQYVHKAMEGEHSELTEERLLREN